MSKLRENIDRILGNSIRCLLPSYWWKRLFGLVVDEVEDVRKVASNKADKSYVDKTIDNALDNALDNVTIAVDTELSTTSTNPVQNKAVTTVLNNKQDKLVSSISIKTINWESLLGEGNINVNDNLLVLYFPDPSNPTLSLNDAEKASNEKVRRFFVSSTTSAPYSIVAYSVAVVNNVRRYYNAIVESVYHNTNNPEHIVFKVRSEIDENTNTFKILTVWIRHDYAGYMSVYTQDIYDTKLYDTSANAVQNKVVTAELAKKQDVLVSGETIKTINGNSILGSGDITIEAGGVSQEDFDALYDGVVEAEEVTAAALVDLDARVVWLSENVSGQAVSKEEFSAALANLMQIITENEEVNAAAWNDLDTRLKSMEG